MSASTQRPMCGPCGSGDRCIQPWGMVDPNYSCNRCDKCLHQLCAAIDATKAPEGKFEDPDSIRICYNCLRAGESPNRFGVVSEEPPAKRAKTKAVEIKKAADETIMVSIDDLEWDTLMKPHESIFELVEQNKAVAPQASKKTIWWRVFHTWNMEDFGDEVVQPVAYCNLCGKSIKMSKVDRSPTPLKRHVQIHHKQLYRVLYEQKLKDGPVVGQSTGLRSASSYNPKKGKRDVIRTQQLKVIVQWIIETDQSLNVVESASFRKMTSVMVMNPRHSNNFDRAAIEEYMAFLVSQLRVKIREKLVNQSLVHVQEYWNASNRYSYQVDRAHWIDKDFKLQSVVLACDYDKSVAQGDSSDSLWESVGVDLEKQIQITVGSKTGGSYLTSACGPLYHGLESELNQIAKIASEALGPDVGNLLQKARELVQTVQSSPMAKEALIKAQGELASFYSSDQPPVELIMNAVEESWWSTQEMIGRLLYLRKALEYLMLDARLQEEFELLTRPEWELLEKVQQLWEPLNIAPQLLQKQKFVTISLVPIILQIIAEDLESFQGQEGVDPKIKECIAKMAEAWEERYGAQFPSEPFQGLPTTIWLAHVLDPRFKALDVFKASPTSDQVIYNALLEKMVETQIEEKNSNDEVTSDDKGDDSSAPKQKPSPSPSNAGFRAFASSRSSLSGSATKRGLQRLSERFSINSKTKKASDEDGDDDVERDKSREECSAELEDYTSVQGMKMWIDLEDGSKDFEDPLTWWQQHYTRFPTLWKLARMYLPIPATCAPSERAFDPEAHATIAKRCQTQASTSRDVKLLKENADLLDSGETEAAEEPEENKDEEKEETQPIRI
jgi:hypothetical protein